MIVSSVDVERLSLMLNELRLPATKMLWAQFAERSDKEGWPAARFLATIAEHEIAERARRRIERHLADARLPTGKTLDGFDFQAVPMVSKAQVMALCAGDSWLEKGVNLILFGPPGSGKSHLATEAETREPQHQTGLFKDKYDEIWIETCPACKCRSFMTGEQTGEDISEERDEHAIWEIVNREFVGEEFRCPTCDLTLMGSDEIDAAGLNYIHEDQQEREMEYEPDYGND